MRTEEGHAPIELFTHTYPSHYPDHSLLRSLFDYPFPQRHRVTKLLCVPGTYYNIIEGCQKALHSWKW